MFDQQIKENDGKWKKMIPIGEFIWIYNKNVQYFTLNQRLRERKKRERERKNVCVCRNRKRDDIVTLTMWENQSIR